MKKNKFLSVLALGCFIIGGLASCGGDTGSNSEEPSLGPTDTPTIAPTDTPTESPVGPADVEFQFWGTFNKDFHDKISVFVRNFENIIYKTEGVKVHCEFVAMGKYEDVETKVIRGLSTEIYPTIAVAYPDAVSNFLDLVPDTVVNLDSLINDPVIGFGKDKTPGLEDNYTLEEGYIQPFIEEGRRYALEGTYSFPFLKSTEIMAYNKDMVESIAIPELNNGRPLNKRFMNNLTWDEFEIILQYIKDNMGTGDEQFDIKWPACYDSDSNLFITKMMQNNIDFIANGKTPTERVLFNNAQAKEEVRHIKDLHDRGLITTKGVEGTYGNVEFKNGNILFDISSSGGASYLELGGGVPVEVVKVPYDNSPSYVSQGPTVTFLKHPNKPNDDLAIKYAFRLIKYLTNATNNAKIAISSGGYVPVNQMAYDTPAYDDFLNNEANEKSILTKNANVVINQVNGAFYTLPCFKGSAAIRDQVGGIITTVLSGSKKLDEAFETAYNDALLAAK